MADHIHTAVAVATAKLVVLVAPAPLALTKDLSVPALARTDALLLLQNYIIFKVAFTLLVEVVKLQVVFADLTSIGVLVAFVAVGLTLDAFVAF